MQSSVSYLGYKLDAKGIHPLEDKVVSSRDAPSPRSIIKLKSYIGLLLYYGKISVEPIVIPSPYQWLQKSRPWKWEAEQEKAFVKSKQLLISAKVLAHLDSSQNLTLACDASS